MSRFDNQLPLEIALAVGDETAVLAEYQAALDPEPVPPKRKRNPQIFRERDITRAIAGTMKAGLAVAGTKIAPDGSIVVITGKPEVVNLAPSDEQAEPANEWDVPL